MEDGKYPLFVRTVSTFYFDIVVVVAVVLALTFGAIVIGGAFVVKYVGTMVLQVRLDYICFPLTSRTFHFQYKY